MTDAEWLACTSPEDMLDVLRDTSARKLRLFAVACCRRIWDLISEAPARLVVERAELYADKLTTKTGLRSSLNAATALQTYDEGRSTHYSGYALGAACYSAHCAPKVSEIRAAFEAALCAAPNASWARRLSCKSDESGAQDNDEVSPEDFIMQTVPGSYTAWKNERYSQSALLRDIFGNAFLTLSPHPESISPLAERIYAGEWNLMPILGEWLQEHGYWSEGEHCLDPNNRHVKGCWVVDWVTGRE